MMHRTMKVGHTCSPGTQRLNLLASPALVLGNHASSASPCARTVLEHSRLISTHGKNAKHHFKCNAQEQVVAEAQSPEAATESLFELNKDNYW